MDQIVEREFALPEPVKKYRGRIIDADSHENIPVNLWVDMFGSIMKPFVQAMRESGLPQAFDKEKDDNEITTHNVKNLKFHDAPGSFDFERRLEVMDFVGLDSQIMYPGGLGLYILGLYLRHDDPTYLKSITTDRKAYAKKVIDAYNDWCARAYNSKSRLRAVAILAEDTPDDLYATAKKFVDKGIAGLWFPVDRPPGGVSPASPQLDKLWDMLAQSGTPVLTHIGADINGGPFKTTEWRNAPAFEGWMAGSEFSLDPWTMANLHKGTELFVSTMILGGVIERHPKLRVGTAEYCGHWVGPLSEVMDTFFSKSRMGHNVGYVLKGKPSEYLRTNVRCATFDFEPVGKYIERFGLEDVYCYASDYPHIEGGKDPFGISAAGLEGQPERVWKKFYTENARFLLSN